LEFHAPLLVTRLEMELPISVKPIDRNESVTHQQPYGTRLLSNCPSSRRIFSIKWNIADWYLPYCRLEIELNLPANVPPIDKYETADTAPIPHRRSRISNSWYLLDLFHLLFSLYILFMLFILYILFLLYVLYILYMLFILYLLYLLSLLFLLCFLCKDSFIYIARLFPYSRIVLSCMSWIH
jgi:hypothetical protein